MRLRLAFLIALLSAPPWFFLGASWLSVRTGGEVQAAVDLSVDAFSRAARAHQDALASRVRLTIETLETLRSKSRDEAIRLLERELYSQTRRLERQSRRSGKTNPLVSAVLEEARAYAMEHPLPRDEVPAPQDPSPFPQAVILPDYAEGELRGLRFTELDLNSFLASQGIRKDDLLVAVDGVPLDSMTQAAKALRRLEAQHLPLRLEVVRDGRRMELGRSD